MELRLPPPGAQRQRRSREEAEKELEALGGGSSSSGGIAAPPLEDCGPPARLGIECLRCKWLLCDYCLGKPSSGVTKDDSTPDRVFFPDFCRKCSEIEFPGARASLQELERNLNDKGCVLDNVIYRKDELQCRAENMALKGELLFEDEEALQELVRSSAYAIVVSIPGSASADDAADDWSDRTVVITTFMHHEVLHAVSPRLPPPPVALPTAIQNRPTRDRPHQVSYQLLHTQHFPKGKSRTKAKPTPTDKAAESTPTGTKPQQRNPSTARSSDVDAQVTKKRRTEK